MAGNPITWRNINAPNFAGVQRGVASANHAITNGLRALQNAAQSVTDDRKTEAKQLRDVNTNALLNEISGLNELDGYENLRQSITSRIGEMGVNVDSQAVLSALNGRDNALRTDLTQQQAFDDSQTTRAEKPLIDAIYAQAETDPEGAKAALANSSIRDKRSIFESLETEAFNDAKEARTRDDWKRADNLRAQSNAIPTVVEGIISATEKDSDLEKNINSFAKENEITGSNLIALRDLARNEFALSKQLTTEEQTALDRVNQANSEIEQRFLAAQEKAKRDQNLLVKEEEIKAWSEQGSAEDAINYIADKSGESSVFEIDTPTAVLNAGVRGRENGAEYAGKAITNVQNDLINQYKDNPDVMRLLDGGIPYAVIKKAFDATPRDSAGEWHYEKFQTNLGKVFDDYLKHQNKIQVSRDFDAETSRQVDMLRQTGRNNYNNVKHSLTANKALERRLRSQ